MQHVDCIMATLGIGIAARFPYWCRLRVAGQSSIKSADVAADYHIGEGLLDKSPTGGSEALAQDGIHR